MTISRDFYLRAAALARTAPENWTGFLAELKLVSDQSKDQILDVPLDQTLVAKGYALACRDILNAMTNCKILAGKIEASRK